MWLSPQGEIQRGAAMRRSLSGLLAGVAALCLGSAGECGRASAADAAPGTVTAIVGATVIHPEFEGTAAVAANSTILIAGNRIRAVGPSASVRVPRGARILDAHGKWVIPELIAELMSSLH